MGLSAIKRDARLAIHQRMSEPCFYADGGEPSTPTVAQIAAGLSLSARFHTKAKLHLGNEDGGMAVMEPIEKVVFNQTELDSLGLVLQNGGEVTFPGYGLGVVLDQQLDGDGPENVYWTVTRV